jgi:uroporphyrinogen III methyltransferase/synthase
MDAFDMNSKMGHVYLVGAGPGSLGLVTLRARELIGQADVLVYDYLSNPEMLRWTRPDAEIVYAGKSGSAHTLTQDEINALLVERARSEKQVVRLKGGDPYVFGRGGEEAQVLARAGISFEVVPGVTSAIAAPAYAGIPVTHRDFVSMVTFITGHEDPSKPDSALDWRQLAQLRGTKVFLMGVERLREITGCLLDGGADPVTPVALVRWGSTPRQESLEGTLATIADLAEKRGFKAPAVTIVGDVVKLRRELNWYEALPLFGQRVVVTRTRKQAGALTKRLAQLGADVLEIPTIRIMPLPLDEAQRNKFKAFSQHFDWVIFTSPNAVELFFDGFFKIAADVRDLGSVKIGAIGPATEKKLGALRLRPALQPGIFTSDKFAEALTAHVASPARFCLPHARLAGPELADHLRLNGHQVEEWTLYDMEPEPEDRTGVRARYLREGAHWITFTSASTVENWHALNLQPVSGAPVPKAISMGPMTSAALRKLGYEITAEASTATIDSLVETISRLSIESRHADK